MKDIQIVERIQRRYTKRIPGFQDLTYSQRLKRLTLETLELRRLRTDLCQCFKIVHKIDDLNFDDFFSYCDTGLRGHNLKLRKPKFRLEQRKHFFALRVVEPWNSLPESTVNAPSLRVFKKKLNSCDLSRFLKYPMGEPDDA